MQEVATDRQVWLELTEDLFANGGMKRQEKANKLLSTTRTCLKIHIIYESICCLITCIFFFNASYILLQASPRSKYDVENITSVTFVSPNNFRYQI